MSAGSMRAPYRVLLVDDDKLARRGLIAMLPWAESGLQVVADLANGEEALQWLRRNDVDILVTDLQMPLMNGLDLIRHVRRLKPELLVVVLSFHEDAAYLEQAMALGVVDYLSKTRFDLPQMQQLLERLRERLDARRRDLQPLDRPPATVEAEGDPRLTLTATGQARDLDALSEAWLDLYWVYDDALWDELRQESLMSPQRDALIAVLGAVDWRIQQTFQVPEALAGPPDAGPADGDFARLLHVWDQRRSALHLRYLQQPAFDNGAALALSAVVWMRQRLAEALRTETVAKWANVSRSYFCTLFRQHTGSSYVRFLRRARIREASRLLRETTLSVDAIARSVGYEDTKYFMGLFVEQMGENMATYRSRTTLVQ